MLIRSRWFLFPAAALLSAAIGFPQELPAHPPYPKIGVVLEGGGALGLAHIGVIRWLEEHHIPASYVAGTSMGGLVGSMYATGDTPQEMYDQVSHMDWDTILSGAIPFPELAYRRKEDAQAIPNGLEFGWRKGIQFPEGFNSGHYVGLVLDQIALPYSGIKSFDDLPIPFGCVGTNLVTGQPKVFRSGSLALALRSTMSLPGIFTPVRTKTDIFVDGGLMDNLPVDVAKSMGAEVTIAVHLASKEVKPTDPMASVAVLSGSVSAVIAANVLRSMEIADVVISVPLEKYGISDYNSYEDIIKIGYQAAVDKAAVLSRFSVDDATWNAYVENRRTRRRPVPTPRFIEVSGTQPKLAKSIYDEMEKDVGKPVDPAQLSQQLTSLAGVGRYARLGYTGIQRDGQSGLLIRAEEKDYAPPLVQPLVVIDGSEYNRVLFYLGARITFLDLGGFGNEWRNDITLGSENSLRSEFYHPLGESRHWFVAPQAYAGSLLQDLYHGSHLDAEYRQREFGGAVDAGYQFGRKDEIRAGYLGGEDRFDPIVGDTTYGSLEGRLGTTTLQYHHIGIDKPVIPSRGLELDFRSQWYDANPGSKTGFPLTELRSTYFQPVRSKLSLFLAADGGSTYTHHNVGFPPFSLGGSRDLLAYGSNQFLTSQYWLFKTGFLRSLWPISPLVGDKVYFLGVFEIAKPYFTTVGPKMPLDVGGALVLNTIFGPVEIGGAYGESGNRKFVYQIGRIF